MREPPLPAALPSPCPTAAPAPAHTRAHQRYRRAAWSVAASVLGRGLGLVTMVLGVSLTVPYLGAERFGVWSTLASLTLALAVLDFGVGFALTNHVATQAARGDARALRKAISGGLGWLALVALAMAALLAGLAAVLPWAALVRASDAAVVAEARQAGICFGVLFGLGLLATGLQRVFAGLQRSFEAHAAAALGTLGSLAALLLCARVQAGVPALLGATLGVQLLAALPLLALLARRGQFSAAQAWQHARATAARLLPAGSAFCVLQLGVTAGWAADSLITASQFGAAQAAVYGTTQRLLQLVAVPMALLATPLWAAYADAQARGDHGFIAHTLRRSLLGSAALASTGVALLGLLAEPLLRHWTHGQIAVDAPLLLAMAVWTVVEASSAALSMALNGCGVLRPQLRAVLLFIALVLPLKWALAGPLGMAGIVWATVIAQLLAVPGYYALCHRQALATLWRSGRWAAA